jgi:hypothetical protein
MCYYKLFLQEKPSLLYESAAFPYRAVSRLVPIKKMFFQEIFPRLLTLFPALDTVIVYSDEKN